VQFPAGLHAMVTAKHLESVAAFLEDLRAAVATVKANPSLAQTGSAATYGLMAKVPLRGMVRKRVLEVFANMYRAGGGDLALGAADPAAGSAEDEPRPPAAKSWLERLALRLLS
jgi:hypothetical protein